MNFFGPERERKLRWDTTYLLFFLGTFVVRFSLMMTPFHFVFWSSLYFLLTLLFTGYSPFYIRLFLFSFAFLSQFSAYFSVLSNFHSKPSLHEQGFLCMTAWIMRLCYLNWTDFINISVSNWFIWLYFCTEYNILLKCQGKLLVLKGGQFNYLVNAIACCINNFLKN